MPTARARGRAARTNEVRRQVPNSPIMKKINMDKFRDFGVFSHKVSDMHMADSLKKAHESITVYAHHDSCLLLRNSTDWGKDRILGHSILNSNIFELLILLTVIIQLCLTIYETDLTAKEDSQPSVSRPFWFAVVKYLFLSLFTLELLARAYIYRWNFFATKWHVLDLCVVSCDVASALVADSFTDMSLIRIFRLARIIRASRLIMYFPEMYIMVRSLAGAFRRVLWAAIIISVMIVIFAILGVSFIHPVNLKIATHDCKDAFASVYEASLTLFLTAVAGDSFGKCSRPLMLEYPETTVFFLITFGMVSMGLMNLALSAIVDTAAEVRQHDTRLVTLTQMHFYEEARNDICKCCATRDTDKTSKIGFDVIMHAFENDASFSEACDVLGASSVDLNTVFDMLDENETGLVSYHEYADHLLRLKTDSQHSVVVTIKHQLIAINNRLLKEMQFLKADMELRQGRQGGAKFNLTPTFTHMSGFSLPGSDSQTQFFEEQMGDSLLNKSGSKLVGTPLFRGGSNFTKHMEDLAATTGTSRINEMERMTEGSKMLGSALTTLETTKLDLESLHALLMDLRSATDVTTESCAPLGVGTDMSNTKVSATSASVIRKISEGSEESDDPASPHWKQRTSLKEVCNL